jgi:choline dehydrogenase-like flavoprotein
MRSDFDVIIIGSGPAGVSAAFPLVQAGVKVLMLDGGRQDNVRRPTDSFISARTTDEKQWEWMVGERYHALERREAVSPKLRVPAHAHVFSDFSSVNRIDATNFIAIGSLAPGGLSNAWGCGVAQLSAEELGAFPCDIEAMKSSYRRVVQRMGVSSSISDDLTSYFGIEGEVQPEIELDQMHTSLSRRYSQRRNRLSNEGFRLGRFPLAVLSRDRGSRKGCIRSNNCLFGCEQRSLYSATEDLLELKKFDNFTHAAFEVEELERAHGLWKVYGQRPSIGQRQAFSGAQVFLAAGTLASTRLALKVLGSSASVSVLSCPTAAFVLWLPSFLGSARVSGFGYSQLAFVQTLREDVTALGSTFSTVGLPMTEFARHLPLRRRLAVDVLRSLMSSCVVGNMFLPGHLSANQAHLTPDGRLHIRGAYHEDVPALLKQAAASLRRAYARLGAYMLPMSFTAGQPGGDIHYAGTLPMRERPQAGETSAIGELAGLDGLFVVDGASLPNLTEKSHTLTIMANADRIARAALQRLHSA